MRSKKKFLTGLLFVLLFLPLFLVRAEKIEVLRGDPVTGHFELGPTRIAVDSNQGQFFEKEITVANHMGEKMGFVLDFEDFTGIDNPDIGYEFKKEVADEISAKEWFQPEVKEFALNHGEKMHQKVKIKVPDDAILGEHQATIFVANKRLKEEAEKQGTNIKLTSRLGIPLLVNVNGTKEGKKVSINQVAEFTEFKTDKDFYEWGPVNFRMVVKNTGNVHVNPFGYISIKKNGKEIDRQEVREWHVYRGSSRATEKKWEKGFLFGNYEAEAVIQMDINGKRQEFKRTVKFTVIPWKLIAGVSGALIFILLLMFIVWRRSLKKQAKRIQENVLEALGKEGVDVKPILKKEEKSKKAVEEKINIPKEKKGKSSKKIIWVIIILGVILGGIAIQTILVYRKSLQNKESIIKQQTEADKRKYEEIERLKKEAEEAEKKKEEKQEEASKAEETSAGEINKNSINIKVLNGSGVAGAAANFANNLKQLGYTNIVKVTDAENFTYTGITIKYPKAKKAETEALKIDLEGKNYKVVSVENTNTAESDILVVVGK